MRRMEDPAVADHHGPGSSSEASVPPLVNMTGWAVTVSEQRSNATAPSATMRPPS